MAPATAFEGPVTPSKSRHRRMPSRPKKLEDLPAFSFNPGAEPTSESATCDENIPNEDNMRAGTTKTRPLPLPDFSFNPGADLPASRDPSPTHPVLQEMALNQQRVSRSARPAPLPAFTLGSTTSSATPSPTRSTFGDAPGSAGLGHRRRGSEFVGGGKEGSQLISTSPAKSEYRPPPVSGHSRGHTHRRSQAISVSDIDTSDLIKAAAVSKARAGSQPATPSEAAFSLPNHSPPRQSILQTQSSPASPQRRDSIGGARPRVGFADRVDVIPRPLSLISSETEGSCSTIRGHSLSGSIISFASPSPAPISAVESPTRVRIMDGSPTRPRPKTADPATLVSPNRSTTQENDIISLPKRPLSASGPSATMSGSPPNKKKHSWFSPSQQHPASPCATPRAEASDPLASVTLPASNSPELARPKTSPERSSSVKKKRKYHTWTSGILRKTVKRNFKHAKRTPTPPALVRRPSDRINDIFDQDDTVVLREPSPVVHRARPKSTPMSTVAPPFSPSPAQDDAPGPVIDLDAAMLDNPPVTPTRGAAARIAKLHSSERRGQADPFGGFHKRAESAPVMQPVNRASFNIHRMGSNTSLSQDVFDEEEEDNFLAGRIPDDDDDSRSASVAHTDGASEAFVEPDAEQVGLALSTDDVVIVDPESDMDQQRSSRSTIEAPVIEEDPKRPATAPMFFSFSVPHSHYASSMDGRTTSASMISSPDAEHVSFESFSRGPRSFGEPNPDFVLRASNEDLPSLTDSLSSSAIPRMSSSANTRSSVEQRAHSVCVPGTSRSNQPSWKRASLASLNRLIPGSANGSKLKFEAVPVEPTAAEEKEKRKSNRLSKLMRFWRTKDRTPMED